MYARLVSPTTAIDNVEHLNHLRLIYLPALPLASTLRALLAEEHAVTGAAEKMTDFTPAADIDIELLDGLLLFENQAEYALGYTESVIQWRPFAQTAEWAASSLRCVLLVTWSEENERKLPLLHTCDGVPVQVSEHFLTRIEPGIERIRVTLSDARPGADGGLALDLVECVRTDLPAADIASKILPRQREPTLEELLRSLEHHR